MATPAGPPPTCYGCLSITRCPIASDRLSGVEMPPHRLAVPVTGEKVSQIKP
jgi:hypothetical protein